MTRVYRSIRGDAVADALDWLAPRIRDGVVVGVSIEWHPCGTARVAYSIAPGVDEEMDLPGVVREEDE